MSQEKISVYNLADLKNTSDDAIPNYLNSLGFTQSHYLTDVRLGLGYAGLAVATACFAWDYKLGFNDTKYYSAAAVIVYMALSAALTLWSSHVEGATVYVGTSPDGETTVSIATSVEKYTPIYNVEVTISDNKSKNSKNSTITISRPFSEWFDGAGSFVKAPFQTVLATSVPAIGKADPKRATTESGSAHASGPTSPPEYSAAMLDMLAAASSADATSGERDSAKTSGASGKKGGKRRKA